MNFFESQERARKKTSVLIAYFILAIVLIIFCIDFILVGLVFLSQDPSLIGWATGIHFQEGVVVRIDFALILKMFTRIAVFISPVVVLVILVGTLFRMITLKAGGIAVAEMSGATPIDLSTDDFKKRRFIHIVEEMSIASGIAVPKLYIMEKEPSINAFVAGIKPSDTVMVVSQGALDELSRDELQGVIGHEFSHILNSDMQISVRLIGLLAGVLLIGQFGTFILRSISRTRSTSGGGKKGNGVLLIFLLGLGLYVVGYIGLFFGRLIKAAISRQRELLADSSSVQFTRNPIGLVGALQKIQLSKVGTYLNTSHAEDISHLCFCPSLKIMFTDLLDTHPPLDYRIDEIDPDRTYRKEIFKKPSTTEKEEKKAPKIPKTNTVLPIIGVMAVQDSIGNPSDAHVGLAVSLLQSIPVPLRNMAQSPEKVALLYAALFQKEGSTYEIIKMIDRRAILPLIDVSIPAFRKLSTEDRRKIFNQLEKLSEKDGKDLLDFTLLGIIGKNIEDRTPKELRVKYNGFDQVIPSLIVLASFIIAACPHTADKRQARFDAFMKKFASSSFDMTPIEKLHPQTLLPALQELNLLAPLCKQRLLKTCLEAIQEDQKISIEEAELIRGIAACLDCPIPPILPTE